jgi:hypothetical protein
MTTADQRYNSILEARKFLEDITNRKEYPTITRDIRVRAQLILNNFPNEDVLSNLAKAAPNILIKEMDPLLKLIEIYEGNQNV